MKAVLDVGALIAVDRRDRSFGARLRVLQHQGTPLRTSAAVVAQVWRDGPRQANLARVLTGVGIAPLSTGDSKRIGELLATARMADVVDGHIALLVDPGDMLFTSDTADLSALTGARGITADVLAV
jgi:hypothetical protein